jgi:hypothetical protein
MGKIELELNNWLFWSNKLSRFDLKSIWCPKFPGQDEVVKNAGLSRTM